MIAFFRCVAEAVMENGVNGLASLVPGGEFACKVAAAAYKKYGERKKEAEQRKELEAIARASFETAKGEAVQAVRDAVADLARTDPQRAALSEAERQQLGVYIAQIPAAVQQSLKTAQDPSGRTVPSSFVIRTPDDVSKLLPPRAPRFKAGDALSGKSGWVLDRPLGVGGFGEVWLAHHKQLTSLVGAVKFCFGQQARDLQHESGVVNRVMQAGQHPNIVPLKDVSLDGDAPWLMYDYVPGGDLGDLVRRLQSRPADERVKQAIGGLRQIASAVAHFHRLTPPVVHRDLKPNNILFDRESKRLRITDFGIGGVAAKAALDEEARGGVTAAGRLMSYMRGSHTPLYASPQQRAGSDPDPRDDVHALGVIAFQLLTGDLGAAPGFDLADDLRDVGAPDALVALIGKSVSQRAERRPKDAGEWQAALAAMSSTTSGPVSTTGGSALETANSQLEPQPGQPPKRTEPLQPAGEPARLNPKGLAILKALKNRGATDPAKAVSKYVLMAEDGCGPHLYDMSSEEGEQGLVDWVEQPKSPVPHLTKSKWTLWITPAGLRAIDNHVLTQSKDKSTSTDTDDEADDKEEVWEDYWFVNVGEGEHRNWDDCRRHGFLAAGGGSQYSDALDRLSPGSKVFAYMKGRGYVGYGEVTSAAVQARDFTPQGAAVRLLELPDLKADMGHDADDEEMADWVVGVRWLKTFGREEAKTFSGIFANPNVVCRLRNEKTLKFLRKEFNLAGA